MANLSAMEVVCKKKHEKNASKVKLSDRTTKELLARLPEIVLEGEHPAEQPTSKSSLIKLTAIT